MNRILRRILLFALCFSCGASGKESLQSSTLVKYQLGSTPNVHLFGKCLLCGQPSAEGFAAARQRGVRTVITLRKEGEITWDEPRTVASLGLTFHRVGFREPDTLTDAVFDVALNLISDAKAQPLMLHCASANRVGAVWLAHRVINDGLAVEKAQEEARQVGLRTKEYEAKALGYISRRTGNVSEKSARPGINERFVDPELQVDEWLARFEVESREVYAARREVLKACKIQPGYRVADIGAGTGFYSRLFAEAVGDQGWVFAVDIAPRFLEHINRQSREDNIRSITSVLATDRATRLPPNSIDLAFVCDTYHHFEYPRSTLASIYQALKPAGVLVVIDFEKIPGKSREFILGHVRAGKQVVRAEIEDVGFRLIQEVPISSFQENYLLRFQKMEREK